MAETTQALKAIPSDIEIGIPQKARKAVAEALGQLLADQHVLYIKTRNYHWNVTGMFFHPLHEMFQEQYTAMEVNIDDIAERIRSLGFFSPGSMKEFGKSARLVETDHLDGDAETMLRNLIRDHETMIQILRHDQEEAVNHGDDGTNDFLIGLMEAHEKMAWMLRAHLAPK